jgi:predicted phosphodiesterase
MARSIRILHLSDFHFNDEENWDGAPVVTGLAEAIGELADTELAPDLAILTGDFAWSGKRLEFEKASTWIQDHLLKNLPHLKQENLFFVPGNHDIDRKFVTDAVKAIEENARKTGPAAVRKLFSNEKELQLILERHLEYHSFAKQHLGECSKTQNLWWAEKRVFEAEIFGRDVTVGIGGLSSSLFSYGEDTNDYGKLLVGRPQLHSVISGIAKADIRIIAMHHPFTYLCTADQDETQTRILRDCSIVLRGHLHQARSRFEREGEHFVLELATGSAFSDFKYPNSFQVIELDLIARQVRVHYRLWDNFGWTANRMAMGADMTGMASFQLRLFGKRWETRSSMKDTPSPDLASARAVSEELRWSRRLPKLPLSSGALSDMGKMLESVREKAFKALKTHESQLQDSQIRANIFLADYRKGTDGYAFVLYMPDGLRKNMNYEREWHITFLPGQGVTGLVFNQGQLRFSRRLSEAEGTWQDLSPLNEEQKASAHKDLEWILSVPLNDPNTGETLGVLNLDGLDHVFKDELLGTVVASVAGEIAGIAACLAQAPSVQIALKLASYGN